MTEYLPVYSRRGSLSYLPNRHHDETGPYQPVGTFQTRRRRTSRIHIANLPPEHSSVKHGFNAGLSTGKLAGTRDSAKRFIRSFITPPVPSGLDPPPTESIARSGSGRSGRSSTPTGGECRGREPRPRRQTMRQHRGHTVSGPASGMALRPALAEHVRTASGVGLPGPFSANGTFGQGPDEKPLASGNGINLSISLAEPMLFLQGFDQHDVSNRSTAMLRGSLALRISKCTKIKAVSLKFMGRAITKWPEGIPPKKIDFEEIDKLMSHTWPFFNAQFPAAEEGTGADHVELHQSGSTFLNVPGQESQPPGSSTNLSTRDQKRLSLQVAQSRSFNKGDPPCPGPTVAQKGYRVFYPGLYVYNFELPIDSHLPETIDVELGSVKYDLEAIVERAGAFKANLVGNKEVVIIRAPSEGSLEQVEPIAISRNWEDQLHYDIVISGKSFPLGAQVPIAFKLTPLAKVQCHRVKVFVTENIEYFCHNKRVHRLEPTRKVQLFEKRADGPSVSAFPGSSLRVTAGGGIPYDARDAAALGEEVPTGSNNLLGDLDGGVNVGPTEMELNVQLPSCMNTRDNHKTQKLHFDTTYQNIQVHHWIKLVMRLSKADANDPSRRRHFEISIDSPFHILSCRASQANIALPAYSSPLTSPRADPSSLSECGCPGAAQVRRTSPPAFVPSLNTRLASDGTNSTTTTSNRDSHGNVQSPSGIARPQAAHVHTAAPNGSSHAASSAPRPIHLTRIPSFNPPAFSDEDPPPPLETPPPQYDSIASPTSGLADYFARLSDAYDTDSEGEGTGEGGARRSRARVEVPLTPGSRVASRSMDEPRGWWPVGG